MQFLRLVLRSSFAVVAVTTAALGLGSPTSCGLPTGGESKDRGASHPESAPIGVKFMPGITSLSPNTTSLAYAGLTITVNGSGFSALSVVRFNGVAVPTSFVNSTMLSASVDPPISTTAGSYTVTVFDSATGLSNGAGFTVTNPVPSVSSVCPCGLPPLILLAGQASQGITVDGGIFATNASILLNGSPIATTWVDRFTLTGTIPSSLLATAGSISLTVFNPPLGGGTSAAFVLPVYAPSINSVFGSAIPIPIAPVSSGSLFVGGSYFSSSAVIHLDGVPQPTIFIDDSTVRCTLVNTLPQLQTRGAVVVNVVNPGGVASNSFAVPVGTANNQGTIRRSPIAPALGTAYSILLENGTPGQPFTLIADAAGTAPIYPFANAAAGFVLAVSPAPLPSGWFPLADGIGFFGPASGLAFDANGRQVGFSLTLPNPAIGINVKVQAVWFSPSAPQGYYLSWARTESL